MKDEKAVKAAVKKILEKHKWFWWMPPANGFGKSGIADFNAVKDGVFIAIETKFGTNKPTAMQRAFLDSVNAESCMGFVVNDKNIEWLDTFLTDFAQSKLDVAEKQAMSNETGPRLIEAIRALQALI